MIFKICDFTELSAHCQKMKFLTKWNFYCQTKVAIMGKEEGEST